MNCNPVSPRIIIADAQPSRAAFATLAKEGYARHVIPDEVQAYIVAPSGKLGAASRELTPLRRKLRALFRQHAKGLALPDVN